MKKFLLISGILGAVLLLGAVFLWFTIRGVWNRAPTEEEKGLLLTVSCLKDYEIEGLNPKLCESSLATWNLDGTLDLEYEYESDKDPDNSQPFYFNSAAEINPTVKEARFSFPLLVNSLKMGIALSGECKVEEVPNALSVGDQRYSAYIKADDLALGTILVVRQGRVVHTLIISGIYVDIKDAEALLRPVLERSKRYGAK